MTTSTGCKVIISYLENGLQRIRVLHQSSGPETPVVCPRVVSVETRSRYFGRTTNTLLQDSVCGVKEEESEKENDTQVFVLSKWVEPAAKQIPKQPTTSQNFQGWGSLPLPFVALLGDANLSDYPSTPSYSLRLPNISLWVGWPHPPDISS